MRLEIACYIGVLSPKPAGSGTSPIKPQPGENPSPELLASELFLPRCGSLAAVPPGLLSELLLKLLPEASSSCAELNQVEPLSDWPLL